MLRTVSTTWSMQSISIVKRLPRYRESLSHDASSPRAAFCRGRRRCCDRQFDDLGRRHAACDDEVRDGDGEAKPAWPGAAGIDVEHAVSFAHERFVRVARDDDANRQRLTGEVKLGNVELGDVVQHMNEDAFHLHAKRFWEMRGPGTHVVVAAYGA